MGKDSFVDDGILRNLVYPCDSCIPRCFMCWYEIDCVRTMSRYGKDSAVGNGD